MGDFFLGNQLTCCNVRIHLNGHDSYVLIDLDQLMMRVIVHMKMDNLIICYVGHYEISLLSMEGAFLCSRFYWELFHQVLLAV